MNKDFEQLKRRSNQIELIVMSENIYKRTVFEQLVDFSNEIQAISKQTNQEFTRVLEQVGAKDPMILLNSSMQHWDKVLKAERLAPQEEYLIEQFAQKYQIQITRPTKVFVPTDELEVVDWDEDDTQRNNGEDFNRVGFTLDTLLHIDIAGERLYLEDIEISVGEVPEHTFRSRPYWLFDIKKYKISLLVNNQYGNRTFAFPYKNSKHLTELVGQTKQELKNLDAKQPQYTYHFIFKDPEIYKADLEAAIKNIILEIEKVKPYLTYQEAKQAVQKLGIKKQIEYLKRYKEDKKLIASPNRFYKDFVNWGDFLGTGRISNQEKKKNFYSYNAAKEASQLIKFKSSADYNQRHTIDPKLPAHPDRAYPEFISWVDFLGTENESGQERSSQIYKSLEEAKIAARQLNIETSTEYRTRYSEDSRLPANPDTKYADFTTWPEFLGLELREVFSTYSEAKAAAITLNCKSFTQYRQMYKNIPKLPASPHKMYADFVSWGDFLGNGNVSSLEKGKVFYPSIEQARAAIVLLGIKSVEAYVIRYKEDFRLPANPRNVYDDFTSWGNYLGTGRISNQEKSTEFYTSYEQAKAAVLKLKINTMSEYKKRYKEDPKLPSAPHRKYLDFMDWYDFLGKEK